MGDGKVEAIWVDFPFQEFYYERYLRDGLITGGGVQGVLNFNVFIYFKMEEVVEKSHWD